MPEAEESVLSHLTGADKLLIVILLSVSFFSYAMVKRMLPKGAFASVSVDNHEVGRIRLGGESRRFEFKSAVGPVVVERETGRVRVAEASCPNKICRKMGWIGSSGGIIVCAPGKLLIQITAEVKNDLDALTR